MWIILIIIVVGYFIWAIDYNIKESDKKKQQQRTMEENGAQYYAEYSMKMFHICGLTLSENSECIVHLCQNQIVVEGSSSIFKLPKDRIMDISIKTSKEVQNSISGAVGGAILLGPIGAFIGGTSTELHRFLIVTYKGKDNIDKCISFDIRDDLNKYKKIYSYIQNFHSNISQKREIDL